MLLSCKGRNSRLTLYLIPSFTVSLAMLSILLIFVYWPAVVLLSASFLILGLAADKITVKSDEIAVKISALGSPNFYPMTWNVPTKEIREIQVKEKKGSYLVCVGKDKLFIPIYKTRRKATAEKVCKALQDRAPAGAL